MRLILIILFSCLVMWQIGLAQQADTPNEPQQGSTVIDLTKLGKTYTISARMELPQVRIFDRRITPDFKEVTAEKSFIGELSTRAEQIEFEPITSGRVDPIPNVEALLKKKRF